MLALFDIDGTLLHGRPEAHTAALVGAMADVWGIPAVPDDVWAIDPAGRTDRAIARTVLRRHGVDDAGIDGGMPDWIRRAGELHVHLAPDHVAPVAARDAAPVLARMSAAGVEMALVTGNLQAIAREKVAAAGIGTRFGPGGGFGCDSEERADLVLLAIDRARGRHGNDEVVVIGDTPRDIAAARAAGVRVVAVTTGAHDEAALAAADMVVPHLTAAADALLA